jgi:Zn-dependent peptidase ImmA (M78 family)
MNYPRNYLEFNETARDFRKKWNIDEYSPIDLFSVVLDKIDNLTLIFLKSEGDLSGSCIEHNNQKVIFINTQHSLGRQRFTVAHELYHLIINQSIHSNNSRSQIERDADQFASLLLLPHSALINYEEVNNITEWDLDSVIKTEQYFQVSHNLLLNRLLLLKKITRKEYESLLPNVKINAIERGYSTKLYETYTDNELLMGKYIKLLKKAWNNNLITKGKKDELLMDAFYDDIVSLED